MEMTHFQWGPAGLVAVNDPAGYYITTHHYDLKGRLIRQDHPDQGASHISLSYNFRDEVVLTENSLGFVQTNQYDILGRLKERHNQDGATYYRYDTGLPNSASLDRLTETEWPNGVIVNYTFNDKGQLEAVTHHDGSESYQLAYNSYTPQDQLESITYPYGSNTSQHLVTEYQYTPSGYLKAIEGLNRTLSSIGDQNAAGQILYQTQL